MTYRERFDAWVAAKRELARAADLLAHCEGLANPDPASGVVRLADRRLAAATRRLDHATLVLTEGRPLGEVLWSLPDDI